MTAVAAGRGSNDRHTFGPGLKQHVLSQHSRLRRRSPDAAALRFGAPLGAGEGAVQWLLRRNCSMTPLQLVAFYLSLCAWSLAIAGAFWWRGATLVMPFASIELLAGRRGALRLCPPRPRPRAGGPEAGPAHRRVHARQPHRPGRVRSRVGARRAGPRRPLADRDLGRGQARGDRPLRPPPNRAAPSPTSCASRCAAAASQPPRTKPARRGRPDQRTTTSSSGNTDHDDESLFAPGLRAVCARRGDLCSRPRSVTFPAGPRSTSSICRRR
jgi:Integral membrane protein